MDYANFRDSSMYRQRLLKVRYLLYSPTVRCVDKSGQWIDRSNDTLSFVRFSFPRFITLAAAHRVQECGLVRKRCWTTRKCRLLPCYLRFRRNCDVRRLRTPRSWFMNNLPILSRFSSLVYVWTACILHRGRVAKSVIIGCKSKECHIISSIRFRY